MIRSTASILGVLAIISVPSFVSAQALTRELFNNDSALDAAKENPVPAKKFGGFLMYAGFNLEQAYDDNVLLEEDNAQDDFVTTAGLNLILEKHFGRHSGLLDLRGLSSRYFSLSDEDTDDYGATFSARIEAREDLFFPVLATYERGHIERQNRTPQSLQLEPRQYDRFAGQLGLVYRPSRLGLSVFSGYSTMRYDDGVLAQSRAPVVNKDLDFNLLSFRSTLSYRTGTDWEPFVEFSYNAQDYVRQLFNNGQFNGESRDNTLQRYRLGTSFDMKGIVFGRVALGWERRNYDDPDLEDASTFGGEGEIHWKPIEKLQLGAHVLKRTQEDTIISEGSEQFTAGLSIDYELQSDLFAGWRGTYVEEEFLSTNRLDDNYESSIFLDYHWTPRFRVGIGYDYEQQDSNAPTRSFDRNVFMVRAQGAL